MVIGGDVTVTVMEVTGQTVRLGIAAPKGLPVYREEIWLAVQAENIAAAESSAQPLPAEPGVGARQHPRGAADAQDAAAEAPSAVDAQRRASAPDEA